jgi:hypothetical protein
LILVGLAALQGTVWAVLTVLARRAPGISLLISLAVTCAGAAVTVMLSGYATGGQAGLPMAGALLGATAAALVLPRSARGTAAIGVSIIGLSSLLVMGRFFGDLTSAHAILLFCAPLLGWLPEVRYLRRLPLWMRGLTRVILVGAVVMAVVVHAQVKFTQAFQAPSDTGPKEPTIQDYMDFGR